jgi:hypothetical protein
VSEVKSIYWKVSVDIPALSDTYVESVRNEVYERIDSVMYDVSADYGVSWSIRWVEE